MNRSQLDFVSDSIKKQIEYQGINVNIVEKNGRLMVFNKEDMLLFEICLDHSLIPRIDYPFIKLIKFNEVNRDVFTVNNTLNSTEWVSGILSKISEYFMSVNFCSNSVLLLSSDKAVNAEIKEIARFIRGKAFQIICSPDKESVDIYLPLRNEAGNYDNYGDIRDRGFHILDSLNPYDNSFAFSIPFENMSERQKYDLNEEISKQKINTDRQWADVVEEILFYCYCRANVYDAATRKVDQNLKNKVIKTMNYINDRGRETLVVAPSVMITELMNYILQKCGSERITNGVKNPGIGS